MFMVTNLIVITDLAVQKNLLKLKNEKPEQVQKYVINVHFSEYMYSCLLTL